MAFVNHLAHMFFFHLFQRYDLGIGIDGILQYTDKFVVIPRLSDEINGTTLQSFDSKFHICVCSHQYNRNIRMAAMNCLHPQQSLLSIINAKGEVHIEQNDVNCLLLQCG